MNSLTETQKYFAEVAIKLLQQITPENVLLHQQTFDFQLVFVIAPFLTGPFNNVSQYGKSTIIESLLKHKIIRNIKGNMYRFTSSEITNYLIGILENNPIVIKNKFINKFSFDKYKLSEIIDNRYEYINVCYDSSEEIIITLGVLKYKLYNGCIVELWRFLLPSYDQNSENSHSRACGALSVVMANVYGQKMDTVDTLLNRIIILLQSLVRSPCNEHANCEHITDTSTLLPRLNLLKNQLSKCGDIEYVQNELEQCKEYLNDKGFDLWDESNSLTEISSAMVQSLAEKYSDDDNYELEQICLLNNPSQIESGLEEGILHEEYEIVGNASTHLSTYTCTNPVIFQTSNDALTSEHFKTITLHIPIHDEDDIKCNEEVIHGGVLDFDTLKGNQDIGSIFTVSCLILNEPYLNKAILLYREILFENESILKKMISEYEEYNTCMAWEIRECLKRVGSDWPRKPDSLLKLEYATSELQSWFIEEMERLEIDVQPNNINENNWKDFLLNVDIDNVVRYKMFEVAQRSQWVNVNESLNSLNDDKSDEKILFEQSRKDTSQLKSCILRLLKNIAKQLKTNVPESKKKIWLQDIQKLQKVLSDNLYNEVALNGPIFV